MSSAHKHRKAHIGSSSAATDEQCECVRQRLAFIARCRSRNSTNEMVRSTQQHHRQRSAVAEFSSVNEVRYAYRFRISVAVPGPPPVAAKIAANADSAIIVRMMTTITIAGRINGSVM